MYVIYGREFGISIYEGQIFIEGPWGDEIMMIMKDRYVVYI